MTPATDQAVVTLQRTLPAPPERVYRAWLDPDVVRRWMSGGTNEASRVEIDERPGGRYRIWHTRAGEDIGGFECELVELVPNERLVFEWGFVGPEREAGTRYDSVLTVTFADVPGGATELTLVHERLEALRAAMPEVADKVEAGWMAELEKLAAAVQPPK